MQTLVTRRSDICLTFAKKALKSDRYKSWFFKNEECEPVKKTRFGESKIIPTLKQVKTRTDRYLRSPIPHLTDLLNGYFEAEKQKEK